MLRGYPEDQAGIDVLESSFSSAAQGKDPDSSGIDKPSAKATPWPSSMTSPIWTARSNSASPICRRRLFRRSSQRFRDEALTGTAVLAGRVGESSLGYQNPSQPGDRFAGRVAFIDAYSPPQAGTKRLDGGVVVGPVEHGHIEDSTLRYLPDLRDDPSGIEPDEEVWVACASGYRASIASSLLVAHGLTPVALAKGGVPDVLSALSGARHEETVGQSIG